MNPNQPATCSSCGHDSRFGENGEDVCEICDGQLLPKSPSSDETDGRELKYTLCLDRHGKPLVTLDSPLGNGQEINPISLRRLATALATIADEADSIKTENRSVNSHRTKTF